jgi:hypothetical protein
MHVHRPVAAACPRSLLVAAPALAAALALSAAPVRADPPRRSANARLASADAPKAEHTSRATPPQHRHAPDDVGQLRDIMLLPPSAGTVEVTLPSPDERDVAPLARGNGPLISADVLAELAARQLRAQTRRNQRAIDGCTAAAMRRRPAVAGNLRLALEVRDNQIAEIRVTDDTVHDLVLAGCLATVARNFHFSLDAAQILWPIAVSPSAAR